VVRNQDIKEYTYVIQLIYMSEMIKEEIRKLAAKSFTDGKLSFNELVDFLGYEDATEIADYKNIAEVSFVQGLV